MQKTLPPEQQSKITAKLRLCTHDYLEHGRVQRMHVATARVDTRVFDEGSQHKTGAEFQQFVFLSRVESRPFCKVDDDED